MSSDDDDVLVVNEQPAALAVQRIAEPARGDVTTIPSNQINLINLYDDDVELVPHEAQENAQEGPVCSMDCCGAAVPVERLKSATDKGVQGANLLVRVCRR